MHSAIHVANESVAKNVRVVLNVLHDAKRQKEVDLMMMRLYEPILWRSLNVANVTVRRNSTAVFIDAFPLSNPEGTRDENEAVLQRQFNQLQFMLSDKDVDIRSRAVRGTCRIIGIYWELIPMATTKALLSAIANDLAYDSSSGAVRIAVLQGLAFILDNHMSHSILKVVLPNLSSLLHDRVEGVRTAFLDLLLVVKNIRSIRFFDVVAIDDLILRLEGDSPKICKRITKLLANSYVPQGKSASTQLSRAVSLLQKSKAAAANFFKHAHSFVPMWSMAKLIVILYKSLTLSIDTTGANQDIDEAVDGAVVASDVGKKKKKKGSNRAVKKSKMAEPIVTSDNEALVESILETMSLIWHTLSGKINQSTEDFLHRSFADGQIQNLLVAFPGPKCRAAILMMAGQLPEKSISEMSETFLPHLKSLPASADENEFLPILSCLFRWKYHTQVLKLFILSLSPEELSKSKKSSKTMEPLVAIRAISALMKTADTQEILFNERKLCSLLIKTLSHSKESVKTMMLNQEKDYVASEMFKLYAKLLVATSLSGSEEKKVSSELNDVFDFVTSDIIPAFEICVENGSFSTPQKRRKTGSNDDACSSSFAAIVKDLVEFMVDFSSEIVLLGLNDSEYCLRYTVSWFSFLLNKNIGKDFEDEFIPKMYKLCYTLAARARDEEVSAGKQFYSSFSEVLKMLLMRTPSRLLASSDTHIDSCVFEVLKLYQTRIELIDIVSTMFQVVMAKEKDTDSFEAFESVQEMTSLARLILATVCRTPTAVFSLPRITARIIASQRESGVNIVILNKFLRILSGVSVLSEVVVKQAHKRSRVYDSLASCATSLEDVSVNIEAETADEREAAQEEFSACIKDLAKEFSQTSIQCRQTVN